MTKFEDLLKKYTKEYENYLKMGLSEEDAITLIQKHVREDSSIRSASPYNLINLFAGDEVFTNVFKSFDEELIKLKNEVLNLISTKKEENFSSETLEQCDTPLVEKKEKCDCEKKKEEVVKCETYANGVKKEIIADTPKHKEFRVTYPNGYYKYKMLMK